MYRGLVAILADAVAAEIAESALLSTKRGSRDWSDARTEHLLPAGFLK